MIVTVVGAGGHVGLPFSLVVANAGHKVFGYDINEKIVNMLNEGEVPYMEYGAETLLREQLDKNNIEFTCSPRHISESDVVAIMLGTPVDAENNPRLDDLFDFVDNILISRMKKNCLIILRSTVAPGTTDVIRDRIENKLGYESWKEGRDFYLVFCPERVLQTKGIEETSKLPQLIGSFNEISANVAIKFFESFVENELLSLTPREAEVAKLLTNMWRYVSFAFANEMWMIAGKQNVDIHKVISAANYDYKRMSVPLPGPNVGGPCLFKDGRFLLQDVPFVDLIQTSFVINEGMPDYIFNKIKELQPNVKTVLILGAAFKANCDDTRNSLSFKMRKVCRKHGVESWIWDPFVPLHENEKKRFETAEEYDAVIVMTPHSGMEFSWPITSFRKDCIMADVWKFYEDSKKSKSGIYKIGDIV